MQEVFEKVIDKLERLKTPCELGMIENGRYVLRDKAIEIVKQADTEYGECYKDCAECETYDKEKYHCPKFCKVIKETVKEIEEYNNGWIPCSERLPNVEDLHEHSIEDCTSYLIQRRCGVMDVAHYIKVYGEQYFEANSLEIKDVIAWQPLPEPYQPKGE